MRGIPGDEARSESAVGDLGKVEVAARGVWIWGFGGNLGGKTERLGRVSALALESEDVRLKFNWKSSEMGWAVGLPC